MWFVMFAMLSSMTRAFAAAFLSIVFLILAVGSASTVLQVPLVYAQDANDSSSGAGESGTGGSGGSGEGTGAEGGADSESGASGSTDTGADQETGGVADVNDGTPSTPDGYNPIPTTQLNLIVASPTCVDNSKSVVVSYNMYETYTLYTDGVTLCGGSRVSIGGSSQTAGCINGGSVFTNLSGAQTISLEMRANGDIPGDNSWLWSRTYFPLIDWTTNQGVIRDGEYVLSQTKTVNVDGADSPGDCSAPAAPTINAVASGCTLPTGGGTCNMTLSWTSGNTNSGLVDIIMLRPDGTNSGLLYASKPANGTLSIPSSLAGSHVFGVYNHNTGFSTADVYSSAVAVVIGQAGTWTTYCTGGSDPNGNKWQWWEKTTTDPIQYRYVRPGDGICSPSVTWTTYCTGGADPNGNNWQWWEKTTNTNPIEYRYVRPGDGICTAAGAQPDLTVSGITPTSAVAGTPTTFSATVTNTGTGSTGIGFQNFYQVRSNTSATAPQNIFTKLFNIAHAAEVITDLAASNMNVLVAGASGVATQAYTFPQAGTYGIRVCADQANSGDAVGVIAESNELNNCGGWTDVNVVGQCNPACPTGTACFNGSCVTSCPVGYTGTPPNCTTASSCPAGYVGTPPNCTLQVCTPNTACTSEENSCGMTNSGTCNASGSACSVSTPAESLCPVLTLSADPTRVRKDTSTKLTWSATGSINSCTITGQNGFYSEELSGDEVSSGPLDAQTTFVLNCSTAVGARSQSVVVNLLPSYIEQ